MAQTPLTSATPYCSAASLMQYYDRELVQDLLRTGDALRPSFLAASDGTTVEGARLLRILLSASGRVESACIIGNRYTPADLAALTGAGLARLERLTAALAFWELSQSRHPNASSPKNVPGAEEAVAELQLLREGKRIFSFQESADAGVPSTGTADPDKFQNGNGAVQNAGRLFGSHGGEFGGRRRWGC